MLHFKSIFNKYFFIITPRTPSFGGVFDMYLGYKIAINQNKKLVLSIPLLNIHKKHKIKKLFGFYLLLHVFKRINLLAKIISIILTLVLNLNIILRKFKITVLIDFIFFKSSGAAYKYFPIYFGFHFPIDFYESEYDIKKKLTSEFLKIKIDRYLPEIPKVENKISFYVKDINYHNLISDISIISVAEIENYRESINLLNSKNFFVERLGDKFSKKFNFENKNYIDNTSKENNSLTRQYQSYLSSEYYFGCGSSSLSITGFFNKPRVLSNLPFVYLTNPHDLFTNRDIVIFKKVYFKREKRILSFQELLNLDLEILVNLDNFILIENSKNEILELTRSFLSCIKKKDEEQFSMSNEFNKIISNFNKKNDKKLINLKVYDINYYKIPNFYLKKYLYPNKNIEKESLDLKFN